MIAPIQNLQENVYHQVQYEKQDEVVKQFEEVLKTFNQDQEDLKESESLKKACEQVEIYFLSEVLKQAQKTTWEDEENALIPKGDYEKTFEDFLTQERAAMITKQQSIGLAEVLYKQLSRS